VGSIFLAAGCESDRQERNSVAHNIPCCETETVLPGGRIFGQKAGKKMVGQKYFIAKFWLNFVKSGQKGAGNLFL